MFHRMMARYGSAAAVGSFIGWVAPGILSLPLGGVAAAAAYAAARAASSE